MTSTFFHLEKNLNHHRFGSFVGSKGCDLRSYDLELNLGQKMPFPNCTRWYIHSTFIISSSTTHLFPKLAGPSNSSWNNTYLMWWVGRKGLMSFSSSFNSTLPLPIHEWVKLDTAVGRTRIGSHHSTWYNVGIMSETHFSGPGCVN